jgi:hypothetical protein
MLSNVVSTPQILLGPLTLLTVGETDQEREKKWRACMKVTFRLRIFSPL